MFFFLRKITDTSEIRKSNVSNKVRNIRPLPDIKQLLDEAMPNIKIYSVETRNIRRGR